MSSFGLKWSGAEFEVGFSALSRQEYESFLEKIKLVADSIWPPEESYDPRAAQDAIERGPSDQEMEMIKTIEARERAAPRKKPARDWREEHGLA